VVLPTRGGYDEFTDPEFTGSWWELELGKDGEKGPFVEHYASLDHAPLKRTLKDRRVAGHAKTDELDKLTELSVVPQLEQRDLERLLDEATRSMGIAVYDVGQGNCNALYGSTPAPLLFFDFGGGVLANRDTYPEEITFCYGHRPPVVLSHWDWDHWASGMRHEEAQHLTWIVPRQRIGANHARFAANILQHGRLLLWPDHLLSFRKGPLSIYKCTGQGRNHSGLAMFLQDHRERSHDRAIGSLLPGDADYSAIPDAYQLGLVGLVATHHGGRMHDKSAPQPRALVGHSLAFSYGEGNRFDHPYNETVRAYRRVGWEVLGKTAAGRGYPRGHLRIGPDPAAPLPCHGEQCTLALNKHCNYWRSQESIDAMAALIRELFPPGDWPPGSGL
jgi:hypothetical protein